MDSSEEESDISYLESNPFAKRVLRSPKLVPKTIDTPDSEVSTIMASSTSGDLPLKRRNPDNSTQEAFEDTTPPSSPSKKLCDMRSDPNSHLTDTNFTTSVSSKKTSLDSRPQNSQKSVRADTASHTRTWETSKPVPVPLQMRAGGRKNPGTDLHGETHGKSAPTLVLGSGRLNLQSGEFDGESLSVGGDAKPLSTHSSGSHSDGHGVSHDRDLSNVKVELHRLPGEKLGMVMGLDEEQGPNNVPVSVVVVKSVTPGGAAGRAKATVAGSNHDQGLRVGDRIAEINGQKINELNDDECGNSVWDR